MWRFEVARSEAGRPEPGGRFMEERDEETVPVDSGDKEAVTAAAAEFARRLPVDQLELWALQLQKAYKVDIVDALAAHAGIAHLGGDRRQGADIPCPGC